MIDVIIILVLTLLVGLAGWNIYKRKKEGGCGCGCAGCSKAGMCHLQNKK